MSEVGERLTGAIIERQAEAACYFDDIGKLQAYNARWIELIGCSKGDRNAIESAGQQLYRLLHSGKNGEDIEILQDGVLYLPTGEFLAVTIIHVPLFAEDKAGYLCFIRPKENLMAPIIDADSIRYFQSVVNRLDVAVWSFDNEKNEIIFVSDAIEDIYEIPPEKVTVGTWSKLIHPDDIGSFEEKHEELRTAGKIVHTYRIITPSGKLKWVRDHTISVKDEEGNLLQTIGSLVDVSESRKLQQKLHDLAFKDELTLLPNSHYARKILTEWGENHKEQGRTFAVIRANLDRFNQVNDVFGPEIGDQILKRVGRRLNESVEGEGVVSRLEGDNFLVLAKHQEKKTGYIELVGKMQAAVKKSLPLHDYDLHITASFGISLFPEDGEDYASLIKASQNALSRAKQLGKDNYQWYYPSRNIESFKSFQLESDLRIALEKKELYFDYQPKIDIRTQKAFGAEALIRWKHPNWGIVSPGEFIHIAEEGDMIHQIGEFVIETICRQVSEWEKQGVPFKFVSFNLSPKNFLKRDLADRIRNCLAKYKVDPSKLDVELTEGSLLQNTEIVKEQLRDLKALGVNIVLDDYGVGYSSIFYLKNYPVHKIKIDRSFISSITECKEDAIIVKSIIDLSKGLQKKVVAEGVETLEQFELLKEMGCELVQGYLFSKPVSPEIMKEMFLMDRVEPKQKKAEPKQERRRHLRIDLPLPLSTNITIVSINDKMVQLCSTEILVENIGLGGLRFISHLNVTEKAEILYGFKTTLLGKQMNYLGKIVWKEEVEKGIFRYGVSFKLTEPERESLSAVLDEFRTRMAAEPAVVLDEQFVREDPAEYIRNCCR